MTRWTQPLPYSRLGWYEIIWKNSAFSELILTHCALNLADDSWFRQVLNSPFLFHFFIHSLIFYFQMVLWQNQTHGSREKATANPKRTRSLPDSGLGISTKWLFIVGSWRGHCQTLPHTSVGWRWILHCQTDNFSNVTGTRRSLQPWCWWAVR